MITNLVQAVDADNEVEVLKRRNQATQRELSRELASCKRRLQQMDQESGAREVMPSSLGSRTSSCSSLHDKETRPAPVNMVS